MMSSQKKLKILCLHGFNNNAESFDYMTRGFRDTFKDYAEFHIIEGPFIIDQDVVPPEEQLVLKGFNPPFRSWMNIIPSMEELLEEKSGCEGNVEVEAEI